MSVDFPQELRVKPKIPIGFFGLDPIHIIGHQTIWDCFNSGHPDRAPIQYQLICNAHEFPISKPRRTTYDWYHPKGILKRNWLPKHLSGLPAVVIFFYDLDWNDVHWNEKVIECASRVHSIRATLDGRSTIRLVIVLIQNSEPIVASSSTEDVQTSEKVTALCSQCEINANGLYVLPYGEHLSGYAIRLEGAFYELAQTYYHNEIKIVRSHRDLLQKTQHQYLIIRHQFKLGFLYELKQDLHNAHKHYSYAYNMLLEVRPITDTNYCEIRTCAGFINYKLCSLLFNINLPRDAISQFKLHVERFQQCVTSKYTYEHYAWLSQQFALFGELFDEAVKSGLPAVQTQHPGIYYQQAAQFAQLRKTACFNSCVETTSYPELDLLEDQQQIEFYGQRPWRSSKLSTESLDVSMETKGMQALELLEKQVNHSSIIISLYGLAIAQYKTYKCPRTRRFLVLQMADEYYLSEDYGKSLTLLTHMLWDFRLENWWSLFTNILQKALRCTLFTANLQDYIQIALEALSTQSCLKNDEKNLIYNNFQRILKKQPPDDNLNLKQWKMVLSQDPLKISIDLTNLYSCIEGKVRFQERSYDSDQDLTLEIFVRSTCPWSMKISRISVIILTIHHTEEHEIDNTDIILSENDVRKFTIKLKTSVEDAHKEIQVTALNLRIKDGITVDLSILYDQSKVQTKTGPPLELLRFKLLPNTTLDFDNIASIPVTVILPKSALLLVAPEYDEPLLVTEWYPIQLNLCNNEKFPIINIQLFVQLQDNINLVELSLNRTSKMDKKCNLHLSLDGTILQPLENRKITFYIRSYQTDDICIRLTGSYELQGPHSTIVLQLKALNVNVTVKQPFDLQAKFLSNSMESLVKFYVDEEIMVTPIVKCTSAVPLVIHDTHLELTPVVQLIQNEGKIQKTVQLCENDAFSEGFLIKIGMYCEEKINIGKYVIKWRRQVDLCNGPATITKYPILGYSTDWIALKLQISVPAFGLLHMPLLIGYHLCNKSELLIQLEVILEASETFMFAGYKQFVITILPGHIQTVQYNLYPLEIGNVLLPKFSLKIPDDFTIGPNLANEQLNLLIDRVVPTHILIMPQANSTSMNINIPKPIITLS